MKNKWKLLDVNALKIIAVVLMMLDHLWASVIPGNRWMTMLGRSAFPIFAFMVAEGYMHTSDVKKYMKRLFVFALISEIPFNLFYIGAPIFPFHQNVMFTLLYGLLILYQLGKLKESNDIKSRIKCMAVIMLLLLASVITFPDYGIRGVLTVVAFYLCRYLPFTNLWQLVSLILLNIVGFKGEMIPLTFGENSFEFPLQGFAVFAILPIWLYNGTKGKKSKILQYAFYLFYPVHMLVLWLIMRIY